MHALWTEFLKNLGRPEYLHVLLNPLPIYGLAAGFFCLAVALAARSRGGQAVALLLIVLTAGSALLVAHYGEAAYDRVYSMSNSEAQKWLNWHAYLADGVVWVDSVAAVLAAAALAGLWRYPRLLRWALPLTAVATAVGLGFGGFLAFVGGKVRHSEFRDGPPPAWAHTTPDED